MPTYERVHDDLQPSYGLHRLDHAVGNAPKMGPVLEYLAKMTGWHEFAEFTAEDVGTMDSGATCRAAVRMMLHLACLAGQSCILTQDLHQQAVDNPGLCQHCHNLDTKKWVSAAAACPLA